MNRIGQIVTHATASVKVPVPGCHSDYFQFDDFLTPAEKSVRYQVRKFALENVSPIAVDYWERAEFPFELIKKMAALGICGSTVKGFGCPGLTHMANVAILLELARVDTSTSTFFLVHNCLAIQSIALCGSIEQKTRYLPDMAKLQKIGCFALSEPERGSDASDLETIAIPVEGGWLLNGEKRWIGNSTFADVLVVWAKHHTNGNVLGFIVDKGSPGLSVTKIDNKISLRIVQNGNITLKDCFVPDMNRMPGAKDFSSGPGKALTVSRVMVAWQPVGIAMGIYDHCLVYLKKRHQFGAPLASFQLNQEKLVRMLGTIQSMMYMALRLSQLYTSGKMTSGQAAITKAINSLRGREVAALGRELLGGNGVDGSYHVARLFCDMESIYTYEGTYDINVLVAGREITGMSAIKSPYKKPKSKRPVSQK